jgi:hypothetical protein
MSDNSENKGHASTEGEAAETQEKISPADLGDWGSEYLTNLWEDLYRADTVKDHRDALGALVFHARHPRPEDHAELSQWILNPFKPGRGRPKRNDLRDQADSLLLFRSPDAPVQSKELVSRAGISKENARGALREAKRRKAARRGEE